MFYTALVRSCYGQGLAMPTLRPGFATIIRKNRGDWFASVLNAGLCSGMHGYVNKYGCEAVLKFFTKRKQTKKIRKRCFFCQP